MFKKRQRKPGVLRKRDRVEVEDEVGTEESLEKVKKIKAEQLSRRVVAGTCVYDLDVVQRKDAPSTSAGRSSGDGKVPTTGLLTRDNAFVTEVNQRGASKEERRMLDYVENELKRLQGQGKKDAIDASNPLSQKEQALISKHIAADDTATANIFGAGSLAEVILPSSFADHNVRRTVEVLKTKNSKTQGGNSTHQQHEPKNFHGFRVNESAPNGGSRNLKRTDHDTHRAFRKAELERISRLYKNRGR